MKTITVILSIVLLAFSTSVSAKPFKGSFLGASQTSDEANFDGDTQSGFMAVASGKSNLGPFELNIRSDFAEWDGVTFCDFDENGGPIAVQIDFTAATWVMSFNKGQLFLRLNASAGGTSCFNFNEDTSALDTTLDIIGGSGRFEGASGQIHRTGTGQGFGNGHGALQSRFTGTLNK